MRAEHVEAALGGGAQGQETAAEAPGQAGPGRGDLRRDGDLGHRSLVRAQLQPGLDQPEPVGLHGDRLAGQQAQDRLERLLHHVALAGRVDAHHERVRGQRARSHAEHDAAAGEVVEQDDAVGQDEGLVVGQGRDARAQTDVRGALRRGGDEHLGRRDDLVAGGVVFAEPGFVETQAVEVLDQLQVALERQRRVLPDRVERGQEDAEPEAPVGVNACHRSPFLWLDQFSGLTSSTA